MRKILALSLVIVAQLLLGGIAHAQMISAKSPSSIITLLQNAGYRAELAKDDSGDPMIKSASSGSNFIILFFGCNANKDCSTVQFFAGYTKPKNGTIAALNQWNATNRFGRAYLSDKGAARLEMDVDLDDGGMSAALFQDNLEFWIAIMASFEKHIGGG